ncbi:C-terminal binding protein [Halostella sp. JP-L12]|uniref:C-terminal binding protein n=1 Tax=Halostella TaxID=1843185 RepID=UPI000EF79F8B|nr:MULTISPECIES: C-terminal binding protein [Halostella]NHN47871.1 C-terminal binding protein [Halostella sp. JP-L12]
MSGESASDSTDASEPRVVGLTAASDYDLAVEREVFDGTDVDLRAVDVATSDDLADAFRDVDAVIDRLHVAPYTPEVIDELERCRVIARCGIGVDGVAHEYAASRGIHVVNVPDYCLDEVADHALALLLALRRNIHGYDAAMKRGRWERRPVELHRLRGSTLGLVGFGAIARRVAERARAFGMDIVASDPYVDREEMADAGVEKVGLNDALARSDAVSAHAPLTDETRGTFDADAFARMRSDAHFLNVARGGLVVEDDLLAALESGEIAGAGLDVFADEPADQDAGAAAFDHPLAEREDVVLTPHVAWYSEEADAERRRTAARDVRRVLAGESPQNGVNDPVDAAEVDR